MSRVYPHEYTSPVETALNHATEGFGHTPDNSYVQVPNSPAFDKGITNSLTFEAWVWHAAGGAAIQRYITLTPDDAYLKEDNGRFEFVLNYGSGAVAGLTSDILVQTNTWYHVVGTYDGNEQRLYVNGALAGSAVAGRSLAHDTQRQLFISMAGQTMNGLIDEPAIYNRALSAVEIESHYLAGSVGMCKVPVLLKPTLSFPGTARLDVKGPPLKTLRLQASTNLANWIPLTILSNFTGSAQIPDTSAGGFPHRFYRAVTP
jgi:hypothetical protein